MSRIALGFDGGVQTGFGAWGQSGLIHHSQGTLRQVVIEAVGFWRANQDAVVIIGVERAYIPRDPKKVGGGVRAVENETWIRCALWASGATDDLFWRPEASAWRAVLEFSQRITDGGKSRKATGDEMKAEALRHHAVNHLGVASVPDSQEHEAEACCIAEAAYKRWHGREMVRTGQLRER